MRATIDNHRDNPRLHWVLFDEAPRAPAFLTRLHTTSRLSARMLVATIESLLHRLIAAPDPVDLQQHEDEIVVLLTGYSGRQDLSRRPEASASQP